MKTYNFIIFFSIVLTIYGAVNYYIFIHGWQSLPQTAGQRTLYLILFLIISLSYPAGRILERYWPSGISDTLVWVGSFWLAAMLYFFLIVLLFDVIRLVNLIVPIYPRIISAHYQETKQLIALAACGLVLATLLVGRINAVSPRVRTLNIDIPKSANGRPGINIVSASDIHLGTLVGRQRFDHLVETINALKPDIIFLPGDIVDEDLGPVIRENLGESLKNLSAPLGVYAITGNHEYIGGAEAACRYYLEHNITVLRDSVIKIDNSFYLVGREDRDKNTFTGIPRKPLAALMAQVDTGIPVIVLDHQPFNLGDVSSSGADLQISGHTHHGQIWPLNYITNAIYEISWGYKKKDRAHFYVSCGFGTWGPPIRLGNRPEIVNIKVSFNGNK